MLKRPVKIKQKKKNFKKKSADIIKRGGCFYTLELVVKTGTPIRNVQRFKTTQSRDLFGGGLNNYPKRN